MQTLTAAVIATSRGSRDTCSMRQSTVDQWGGGKGSDAAEGGQQLSLSLRLLAARGLTGCRSVMYTMIALQDRSAVQRRACKAPEAAPKTSARRQQGVQREQRQQHELLWRQAPAG